ncbi:hypothetical protein ACGFNU_38135 [Spirillospora sp. NPDC048911]|uniref:hypothetical protein n=1 Tax=Spirillospora sp. NPDC048911 TaxID=3364527 RepID=UPI0037186B43
MLDRDALSQALKDAATRFGGIDVLHKELAGTGVQAAHVGINVSIGVCVIPGLPTAQPEEISPVYWDLHTTHRDEAERVLNL